MNPATPTRPAPTPARPPADAEEGEGEGDETPAAHAPTPAASPPSRRRLAVLVDEDVLRRLDRAAVTLARGLPGVTLDRAAAVRVLLSRGLDALERGSGDAEEPPEMESPATEALEGRVRETLERLARSASGGTVTMDALRRALPDVSGEALDAALAAIRRADAGPETV